MHSRLLAEARATDENDPVPAREERTKADNTVVPGCAAVEDEVLVARAAEQIRSILAKTVARGMEEVGEYLLREFYDNSPALYHSTNNRKHASLRLLESHCETMDLPVRRRFLANCIRIAVLSRELPKGAMFNELPPSHRVELLKLRSADKIEQVAARAVDGHLTVQKLREFVRKTHDRNKSGRGRRPTPPPLSALRACARVLRDAGTGRLAFRKEEIVELEEGHLVEAAELIENLQKRLHEFARLIG